MRLAKQRGIHSTPEKWERVRRRARKNNETISRFGERCCRRAAEALGAPPSAPPGHPLALPEDDQRRLLAHGLAVERGTRVSIQAPGGERVDLPLDAVIRFLVLCEEEGTIEQTEKEAARAQGVAR